VVTIPGQSKQQPAIETKKSGQIWPLVFGFWCGLNFFEATISYPLTIKRRKSMNIP
jgi:hypothetical protein